MQIREHQQIQWDDDLAHAEAAIPIIGRLYRERGVVVSLFGRPLLGQSPIGILKAHRYSRHIDEEPPSITETLSVLTALDWVNTPGVSVDIGQLLRQHRTSPVEETIADRLRRELAALSEAASNPSEPRDVVLYGFGRIGRMLARILVERAGGASALTLRAIVVKRRGENDLAKRASLLRRDSIHGPFEGSITIDTVNNTILANGTLIQVIYSDAPDEVDYTAYGLNDAIIVDNTGKWRDEAGLSRHLAARGASRVLLTAPGKGALPNIVHGVNDDLIADQPIITAASCTTNAIVPVLKVIEDAYGISNGHVETVHSFTNDQNLVDNFHPAERRGRAAGLNMVITETGAAKAAEKALPNLAGKLSGSAVRVPTPNVSLAILSLTLDQPVTAEDVNALLRSVSLEGPLRRQIDYIESPEVVSTDFLGSRRAGIVDGLATIATGGTNIVLYVWYDNESGYSRQVHRVLTAMAGQHEVRLPGAAARILEAAQ
ncbi:glyceraldehyde-3-phosphate dehydrogenase [Curtobacterium sp. MCPF17_018]|nr:glyceraldehyde-3-phosphate dehydrogenase [Curtobacterium sp. MCPF17_018]PZE69465.1 glyceraldehyde-3-phosphate dehydrogenase [Curtobacterium sp. MCPF17_018]